MNHATLGETGHDGKPPCRCVPEGGGVRVQGSLEAVGGGDEEPMRSAIYGDVQEEGVAAVEVRVCVHRAMVHIPQRD